MPLINKTVNGLPTVKNKGDVGFIISMETFFEHLASFPESVNAVIMEINAVALEDKLKGAKGDTGAGIIMADGHNYVTLNGNIDRESSIYFNKNGVNKAFIGIFPNSNALSFSINGQTKLEITPSATLVGGGVDNGLDALQVNGSINANTKILRNIYKTGTFTGGAWHDIGIDGGATNWDNISTYVLTVVEDSFNTPLNNYQLSYKFLLGFPAVGSNNYSTIEIPNFSCIGHALNGQKLKIAWNFRPNFEWYQQLQFQVADTATFDNTAGKTLRFVLTKLV